MGSKFSKVGFILAVAGSAMGFGSIWKFPILVGQNGGPAFVPLYLVFTLGAAFVVPLAELNIGELGGEDPVNGYKTLAFNSKKIWSTAGFAMLGATSIVPFYSLVIGWVVKYMYLSMSGNLSLTLEESGEQFNQLLHYDFIGQFVYFSIIFLIVFYVVSKGVRNGIEELNMWMMPTLFILLILMLFHALSHTNGFSEALQFPFVPDLSKTTGSSILGALAPVFFSLSLGAGAIITYSASLPDRTNLITDTLNIIFINALIGLIMELAVFTFTFEFGANPNQAGPGLMFISLTTLFAKLDIIGHILGATFFLSLILAGITSIISMIEPFAFYLIDSFNTSRREALTFIGIIVYILGNLYILSSLSATAFMIYDMSFFDVLDHISGEVIMLSGRVLAAIFVDFVMKRKALRILLEPYMSGVFFKVWYFLLRFITPLATVIIVVNAF